MHTHARNAITLVWGSLRFAPIRQFTKFYSSNAGALWLHKYFMKGTFYFIETFLTRLMLTFRLLVNAHNGRLTMAATINRHCDDQA